MGMSHYLPLVYPDAPSRPVRPFDLFDTGLDPSFFFPARQCLFIFQDIFSDVEGAVTGTTSTSAGDTLLLHQLIFGLPPAGQNNAYNHCREDNLTDSWCKTVKNECVKTSQHTQNSIWAIFHFPITFLIKWRIWHSPLYVVPQRYFT